jgi:hypothetical protein
MTSNICQIASSILHGHTYTCAISDPQNEDTQSAFLPNRLGQTQEDLEQANQNFDTANGVAAGLYKQVTYIELTNDAHLNK